MKKNKGFTLIETMMALVILSSVSPTLASKIKFAVPWKMLLLAGELKKAKGAALMVIEIALETLEAPWLSKALAVKLYTPGGVKPSW